MEPTLTKPGATTGMNTGAIPLPSPTKPVGGGGGDKGGKKVDKGATWQKWVWILVALLIVGGVVYFMGKNKAEAPAPEGVATEEAMLGAGDTRGPSLLWEFASAGGDPNKGAPLTKVMLVINGETRDLGTAQGNCMIVDGSGTSALVEGEITSVVCSFGGAGTEYGVFYDAGTYVVKKGVIEEGTAEEPGMRGEFEALFTI